MPGKKRLKPYVIERLTVPWNNGRRYIARGIGNTALPIGEFVTGPSEEVVRQRMAKKHPEYVEQPRLLAMEEGDMSSQQRIEDGGEQR